VSIDTGKLIKELRFHRISPGADKLANLIASNLGMVTALLRVILNVVHGIHRATGTGFMSGASRALRTISRNRLPLWNPAMPKGAPPLTRPTQGSGKPAVVYFPTCINRSMGPALGDDGLPSLSTLVVRLLEKGGYRVILPEQMDRLCCGMAFASKGFRDQGDHKAMELQTALIHASNGGEYPVLVDMSPCLYRMKEVFTADLKLYEPVRFVLDHLMDRLEFSRMPGTVAVHTTCSSEKMGLAGPLRKLAEACAEHVVAPAEVGCCGWAGDRGFTYPELNASALRELHGALPPEVKEGFSTSRTCEIGLTLHSGVPYRSILYLVDRCTRAKV
jgi:D-lactate dehydrogenase